MAGDDPTVKIVPGNLEVTADGKSKVYPVFKVDDGGQLAGWVVKAGGQGYADKIELLLGLDPTLESMTGLFVLEQKETPGLGNKITFADWRGQFPGKSTDTPLVVQKGGAEAPNGIDAITGATISSRAVTTIVNQVVAGLKGNLTPDTFRPQERQ
jgi:electron transport complex protein RnfG